MKRLNLSRPRKNYYYSDYLITGKNHLGETTKQFIASVTLIRTIDQWAKSNEFNTIKLGNRIVLYSTVFEIRPIVWNTKHQKHLFILLFGDEHLFQVEPAHPQVQLTQEQLQESYISKSKQSAYFLKEGDRIP